MRLKTLVAPDAGRALAEVRRLLGDDAIIVATQDLGAGGVRVTAATEDEDLDLADLLAPTSQPAATPWLTDLAAHHGVPDALLGRFEQALNGSIDSDPEVALGQALHQLFRFTPLPSASPRPILLVGPPGAGKTASTAKLAARSVLARGRVEVVTADVDRAGGAEQLGALLSPLGIEPRPAPDPAALKRVIRDLEADLVLVDTPGFNPFRPADLGRLSCLIEACGGDAVLVLPGGLAVPDCIDIAETHAALGIRRLLPTKLDAARRLGGLLAAAAAGLSFADAGIGPTIGRGLSPLNALGLARLLVHAQKVVVRPKPGARRSGGSGHD